MMLLVIWAMCFSLSGAWDLWPVWDSLSVRLKVVHQAETEISEYVKADNPIKSYGARVEVNVITGWKQ